METIINIENISKTFNKNRVLDNISLEIDSGNCYCLIGKNGVGKSTLLNIVSDIYKPDSGKIKIFGLDYENDSLKIKKNVGILPENIPLINELTGIQYLKFIALLYSIDKREFAMRQEEIINYFFDNDDFLEKNIQTYSKGMKIKLAFCSILLHKPQLLILDEPFLAWDPIGVNALIDFLNEYTRKGNTILLSSHNLLYIDKIATHVGILNNSKIIFSSTLSDFKEDGNLNIDESIRKHINTDFGKTVSWI